MAKTNKQMNDTSMNVINETIKTIEKLDEATQISVLRFAEFLAAKNEEEDIALYDQAKVDDDGYRISSNDLKKKYGL